MTSEPGKHVHRSILQEVKQVHSTGERRRSNVESFKHCNLDHQTFGLETLISAPVHATRTRREGCMDRHVSA
jgi:hypothetical protein